MKSSATSWRHEIEGLKRLSRYAFQYKSRLVVAIAASIVVSLVSVGSLSMIIPLLDIIFEQKDYSGTLHSTLLSNLYEYIEPFLVDQKLKGLLVVCGVYLCLNFINGILRYAQEYLINWIGNRVVLDLQTQLYDVMTGFKVSYFDQKKVGSIISYFTVDIRTIGITIFNVFGRLMTDPIQILVFLVILLYLQWKLTLLYSFLFPVIIFVIQFFARKNRNAGHEAQSLLAKLGGILQEHFSYIRLVKCYNMYDHQRGKFWREARGVFSASMSMAKAMAASSPINEFIGTIGISFILLTGGLIVFHDESSLNGSEFIFYLVMLGSVYQPTKRLERSIQQIQVGLASAERIFSALDETAYFPADDNTAVIDTLKNNIEFQNVSFSYDQKTPVLENICFSAVKGEQIAFVGPSGAGKSTLANLIPRFYDPCEGRVLLDGQDIQNFSLRSLRNLISYVPQEVMIFNDTVSMNITCGVTTYSREDVIEAAKAANAHDFISKLPQDYDTVVGERGTSLSGGQCQRIAIARAFLRNTPILIFDEATSSLDSESEQRIKESMSRLVKGRTSFIIAHRLSTILKADKIVVLDQGKVVDIGTHDELLQTCPLYLRLYQIQFDKEEPLCST
jgi:ATP-binding cassette, subfamily B, bacterial MsbA